MFSVIVSVIYQIKPSSGGSGDGSYLDAEDDGAFSREQEEARGSQEWTLEGARPWLRGKLSISTRSASTYCNPFLRIRLLLLPASLG
ncbi:hypothetical protein RHMOL_Rhmol09G0025100 [Rhododendron molle]|uniref:Uncharacterized protein n=1 Tax=Rhododendron molle TaxID=49168 RepID=A0ACC0MAD7_RHOML|nr:hypothetical protein RHMOL_Rhmol09G0025100 [Rhododendron molle]